MEPSPQSINQQLFFEIDGKATFCKRSGDEKVFPKAAEESQRKENQEENSPDKLRARGDGAEELN